MSHFQEEIIRLKDAVNQLTQRIMLTLEKGQTDAVDTCLNLRQELLLDIISLATKEIQKGTALREYLLQLQQRDEVVMKMIFNENSKTAVIKNLEKIKKYFASTLFH